MFLPYFKEHHGGSISNLQLWKEQVHPKNVLREFSKSLNEIFGFDETQFPDEPADQSPGGKTNQKMKDKIKDAGKLFIDN